MHGSKNNAKSYQGHKFLLCIINKDLIFNYCTYTSGKVKLIADVSFDIKVLYIRFYNDGSRHCVHVIIDVVLIEEILYKN